MQVSRKTLGKNLRALIKDNGYPTIEKFAYENGISKSWLGKVIAGKVEPGLYKMVKVARALECDLDDLYPMKRR